MYEYRAWLTAFVDADTIHCTIDLGIDIATAQTIRLYGINAPEMSTPEGKASAGWLRAWFASYAPDNKFVLRTIKDKREKYGRYLGVVLSNDLVHNLNDELVAAGQAVPYFPK